LSPRNFTMKPADNFIFSRLSRLRPHVRECWAVSWPMTVIMFFIFLIGLADVYVAGRINKEVQAAYGLSSQLYFIFSIVAFALSVGSVSVISQLFTSERKDETRTAVDSTLAITAASGIAAGAIGFFFGGPIIRVLDVPAVIKDLAIPLMQIYSLGMLFNYLLISTNSVLRACRMIKRSLLTMAMVSFLNIALNFILAFKTPLGYRGIAAATGISMLFGCLLNLAFVRPLMAGVFSYSWRTAKKIINIGWPAGLLQVFWQMGAVALYLILSAMPRNNVEVLAAFTNGLKVEAVIFLPAFAFNMANAVIVGNFIGKEEKSGAFRAGLATASIGVVFVSIMSLAVMLNAGRISGYLSTNSMVVQECSRYIFISLLVEPVMAWGVILGGALNGAGDTKGVMSVVAASVWLVRIPLAYLLGIRLGWGQVAVWWSMNISIIVQSIFMTRRYFAKKWLSRPGSFMV